MDNSTFPAYFIRKKIALLSMHNIDAFDVFSPVLNTHFSYFLLCLKKKKHACSQTLVSNNVLVGQMQLTFLDSILGNEI